jgi:Ca2+-binding RTX toxin-like protein
MFGLMRRGVALIVFVLFAVATPLAAGHVNPPGCTQAALSFDWGPGLNTIKRNGDVVSINAMVGNDQIPSGACDITDATVTLTFPNPDGSDNGQQFVLATDVDLLANAPKKSFGTRNLTANFNDGVFRGFVTIAVSGVVHGSDPDPANGPIGSGGRLVVISRPHVTFTVSPAPSVSPPHTVTYTYTAENDSPQDPAGEVSNPTPGVGSPKVTDDHCSPVTFTGGDTHISDPSIVDPGETWTYQCTRSLPLGSLVDVATFTGISTRDGRLWPRRRVLTAFCGRMPATIVGNDRANTITGTSGPDVIVGRGGNDAINGLGGNDIICGGEGNDTIRGRGGDDTLRGESGADKLIGGSGLDTLVGGPGADIQRQ